MSITKRTFLIVSCIICAILLTLNGATYLLFRYSITHQLITSQEAVIEANVRLSKVVYPNRRPAGVSIYQ